MQGRQGCGGIGRRHAGAEDHGAGMVFNIMDNVIVAGNEAAERGEGFAEGGHDQVNLTGQIEMGSSAVSTAEHAGGVGVVHHQAGAIFFTKRDDLWQGCDIALHAVQPVHHHQFTDLLLRLA